MEPVHDVCVEGYICVTLNGWNEKTTLGKMSSQESGIRLNVHGLNPNVNVHEVSGEDTISVVSLRDCATLSDRG